MSKTTFDASAHEPEGHVGHFGAGGTGSLRLATWLVGLGLVALFASPASASAVPPAVFAVAGDAFLTLLGVSGLAALTARSERWHPSGAARRP